MNNQRQSMLLLSFVEMWERFSYYGMRALLVLYLTSSLGFTDGKAYTIYSLFAAIGYAIPVIAGIMADRLIGFQKTLIIGAIIMCLGHLSMTFTVFDESFIYIGLAMIATGTGFFKGNVTNLLGSLYKASDINQRDKALSLFNVAVNLGSLAASLSCGYVAHELGWHYGFGLAGIGMLLGLIIFLKYRHILGDNGTKPSITPSSKNRLNISNFVKSIIISITLMAISITLLRNSEESLRYLSLLGPIVFIAIGKMLYDCNRAERVNIAFLLILTLFFVCFIAVEMQLGSLINLFVARNVEKTIFGYEVPAAMLQGLNPLFVIIFGSMFATIFSRYGFKFYMERFAFGLLVNVLCFAAIYLGCINSNSGIVSLGYITVSMALMSFVEICLFPMMNAMFIALAPPKYKGFMMGVLLFGLSYSNLASVILSKFMSIPTEHIANPIASLAIYQDGFHSIMIFATTLLVTFLLLFPMLKNIIKTQRLT